MKKKQPKIFESTKTVYYVHYGPKDYADRVIKEFHNIERANDCFKSAEANGYHVDVYEEVTTTKTVRTHLTP